MPACPLLSKRKEALSVRLAWTWKRRLERAEGRRRHHASYSLLVVGKDRPLLSTPSILPSHHACTYICSVFSPREPTRVCVYTQQQSNSVSNVKRPIRIRMSQARCSIILFVQVQYSFLIFCLTYRTGCNVHCTTPVANLYY